MKVRQGFVSNSSSTSFLVAIRPSNRCQHCGRGDIPLSEVFAKSDNDDTKFKKFKDLGNVMIAFPRMENSVMTAVEAYLQQPELYTIAHLRVSDLDGLIHQVLENAIRAGTVIKIMEEHP